MAAGKLTIGDVMLVNQMIFQLAKPLSSMGTAFNRVPGAGVGVALVAGEYLHIGTVPEQNSS